MAIKIHGVPVTLSEEVADRLFERYVWDHAEYQDRHSVPIKYNESRTKLFAWIDEHTTSKFRVGGRYVWFSDEKDALLFRLAYK